MSQTPGLAEVEAGAEAGEGREVEGADRGGDKGRRLVSLLQAVDQWLITSHFRSHRLQQGVHRRFCLQLPPLATLLVQTDVQR